MANTSCCSCGATPALFPERSFWTWPAGDPWAGEVACSGCWEPQGTPLVVAALAAGLVALVAA